MNRAIDRVLWPALWAATLLFVAWGTAPRAALFTTVLSPGRLIAVASLVKLALLALGAAWSWRSRRLLDAENPVRPAWTLVASGLACNVLGMTADEAVRAATWGGARALQLDDVGHLSPGARGDLVVLDGEHWIDIPYHPGMNLIGKYTLFAEGARGSLTKRLTAHFKLRVSSDDSLQDFAHER